MYINIFICSYRSILDVYFTTLHLRWDDILCCCNKMMYLFSVYILLRSYFGRTFAHATHNPRGKQVAVHHVVYCPPQHICFPHWTQWERCASQGRAPRSGGRTNQVRAAHTHCIPLHPTESHWLHCNPLTAVKPCASGGHAIRIWLLKTHSLFTR